MAITAGAEGEVTQLSAAQVNLAKLIKSDVNKDGSCNTNDVSEVLRAAIGINAESDAYDIDSNGYTSTEDALVLLRHASGVAPLVTNAELLDIANEKLNGVKAENPGFYGVSTAKCTSMKITQKLAVATTGSASGADKILVSLLEPEIAKMNYTDLEYDKYLEKMIEQLESSKKSETDASKIAEIDKEIESMRKSATTYKEEEVVTARVTKGNSALHEYYFPVSQKEFSSNLAISDIDRVTYSINSNGEVIFNIFMKTYSYNNSTYPEESDDLGNTPYGKAFNIPFLRGKSGTSLTKAEYKNGKIVITLNQDTQAIEKAVYSYSYFSDTKAAQREEYYSSTIYVTADMSTKMYVDVNETFTF